MPDGDVRSCTGLPWDNALLAGFAANGKDSTFEKLCFATAELRIQEYPSGTHAGKDTPNPTQAEGRELRLQLEAHPLRISLGSRVTEL
jgi:hypothetical protein